MRTHSRQHCVCCRQVILVQIYSCRTTWLFILNILAGLPDKDVSHGTWTGPLLEQIQAEVQPGQDRHYDSPGNDGTWLVCE